MSQVKTLWAGLSSKGFLQMEEKFIISSVLLLPERDSMSKLEGETDKHHLSPVSSLQNPLLYLSERLALLNN